MSLRLKSCDSVPKAAGFIQILLLRQRAGVAWHFHVADSLAAGGSLGGAFSQATLLGAVEAIPRCLFGSACPHKVRVLLMKRRAGLLRFADAAGFAFHKGMIA